MITAKFDALVIDRDAKAFQFLMRLLSAVGTSRTNRVVPAWRGRCSRDAVAPQNFCGKLQDGDGCRIH
jgi:hypothetical protein